MMAQEEPQEWPLDVPKRCSKRALRRRVAARYLPKIFKLANTAISRASKVPAGTGPNPR